MAFGGNCPQCALSHYACQHLLSSTNYNPDSQHLSKYVIRANVTATKFVCLEKRRLPATWASQTLSGEMSPNSAFCGLEYHKLYENSIILLRNPSSGYFSPKGRTKYFDRKYISLTNCIWSKCHRSYERAFLSILSISWKTFLKKRKSKLNFCSTCLHFVTKTVKIATTSCNHLNA